MHNKFAAIAAKAELKVELDKLVKLQEFYWSYCRGKSGFEDAGIQKSLVFRPLIRYFKKNASSGYISASKSKGLSDESFKVPTASINSLGPSLIYFNTKTRAKFHGSYWIRENNIYL